jgi:aspartyl/glutamyl-tRNA(Asn/Gln) amidotransferase C subunit
MTEKLKIDPVADLARIHLRPEEREKLRKDLSKIVDYVDQLGALNTEGVPETSHVLHLANVFRCDEHKPQSISDDVLKHAPQREDRFFKVPKVIEGQ